MNSNALPYALGAILLGAVGIWFHDFALQWQPVPAGFPFRVQFASASGVLLIVGGAAILTRTVVRVGALMLASAYGLWLLILHGPILMSKPGDIGTWNGIAEIVFMITGAVTLYAAATGALRDKVAHGVCIAAGLSALVFGAAHFKYAQFTANMVPTWLPPSQIFWTYATGVGHLAAGLSLLSGIRAQLGATLLAVMMALFVLLVHVPRVIAAPGEHLEWIMLGVALSLSGSAWAIRKYATNS
jgi:uncharacterized membrane protein